MGEYGLAVFYWGSGLPYPEVLQLIYSLARG